MGHVVGRLIIVGVGLLGAEIDAVVLIGLPATIEKAAASRCQTALRGRTWARSARRALPVGHVVDRLVVDVGLPGRVGDVGVVVIPPAFIRLA